MHARRRRAPVSEGRIHSGPSGMAGSPTRAGGSFLPIAQESEGRIHLGPSGMGGSPKGAGGSFLAMDPPERVQ